MTAGGSEGFRLLGLAVLPGADPGQGSQAGRAGRDEARPESATRAAGAAGASAQADFEIPAGSALFDGHFPGRPILPGIAHLALVRHALRELAARRFAAEDTEIVAVHNLRLRLPVNPGDRLALRLAANGAGGIRFDLRRGADLVSQGEVRAAGPGASTSPPPPAPRPGTAASSVAEPADATPPGPGGGFPPTAALLPHAPPARLLSAVLSAGATAIVCAALVPAGHPLAAQTAAPGFLALEIAAQAAGCLAALRRQAAGGGAPAIGYLVGARHAELAPSLPCGVQLRVSARLSGSAAALAVYDFALHPADADAAPPINAPAPLAAGTLSTFLPATG